jgi:ABC-2 type transport system permease protein
LITGFIFPRSAMPAPIYQIGSLLPTTYFIRIIRGIVVRGATFQDLWSDYLAVLILTGAAAMVTYWAAQKLRH